MALSVMHIGAVNQRDSLGGPDGLSTPAADTWRHQLAALLVPEPLHVTPSEDLGLGARSSTAKFAVPGSLLILSRHHAGSERTSSTGETSWAW